MRIGIVPSLLLTAITLFGCAGDGGAPEVPSYSFWEDYPSTHDNCCGQNYVISVSGTAPPGGSYYMACLTLRDSLILKGEPVWIDEGAFSGAEVYLAVSHLDNLLAEEYRVRIFSAESSEGLIRASDRVLATEGSLVEVPSYADSTCATCCSRDPWDTNGEKSRRYCMGARAPGSIVGVKARTKTRWGQLCGGGGSTEAAQSNAFVLVHSSDDIIDPPNAFMQAGYMKYRSSGATDDVQFMYVERLNLDEELPYFMPLLGDMEIDSLEEGDYHDYEVILNEARTGWRFLYDNGYVLTMGVSPEPWPDTLADWVSWQTEILKRETDMPGTSADPCVFADCMYMRAGEAYTTVTFTEGQDIVRCTGIEGNPIEWDALGRNDTLFVWDLHPLGES